MDYTNFVEIDSINSVELTLNASFWREINEILLRNYSLI